MFEVTILACSRSDSHTRRMLGLQRIAETLVGCTQFLGMHPRFASHGHKIRIAIPPRQHMQMQMPRNAGARSPAEVHPEVDSVGFVSRAEDGLHLLCQGHDFLEGTGLAQM